MNFFLLIALVFSICASAATENTKDKELYAKMEKLDWQEVLYDSCADDWKKNWMLDGKKATIKHSHKGMDFLAGSIRRENESHAVLWTKQSFEGDIRFDYEYTKLDDVIEAVTILYIQASGSGATGYNEDITLWAKKREIPAMSEYYKNMNLIHISYAAFNIGNQITGNDYIRARRYMPGNNGGLRNTDLSPDYFKTGLFEKGIPHKITIIKKGNDLFMFIRNNKKEMLCHWKTNNFPEITKGRIGLRHMWTRGARYKDFRVSQIKN